MRRRVDFLYERWRHFWFEPALPFNLAFCRVLFYGSFFLFYLDRDISDLAEVGDAFWKPVWLFSRFHLPLLSKDQLVLTQTLWKVALALSCIGLFTRTSTITAFILGAYLLGLPHNFGKINHNDAILVFAFGVMALSRCGDSLSVDRLLFNLRRGTDLPDKHPKMSGEYTWPVRVVWLVMALIFFGAGMSKIRHSGIEWITSDNLAILLIRSHYYHDPLTSWGLYIAQHSWLCKLLASATIVFEAGYPLALFSRKARWIVVPVMASIQIGIAIFMGIGFRQFLICNLFWIPWDRVGWAVRSIGAFGFIVLARPGWVFAIGGVFFLCLIYYAALNVWKSLKRS